MRSSAHQSCPCIPKRCVGKRVQDFGQRRSSRDGQHKAVNLYCTHRVGAEDAALRLLPVAASSGHFSLTVVLKYFFHHFSAHLHRRAMCSSFGQDLANQSGGKSRCTPREKEVIVVWMDTKKCQASGNVAEHRRSLR